MKKFFKFLCGAASVAAVAFGAYCVYKNVIADDEDDDDFEDCFEEDDADASEENREYVSINITEDAPAVDLDEEEEEVVVKEAEENTEEVAEEIANEE